MSRLANVAVAAAGPGRLDALVATLTGHGCSVHARDSAAAFMAAVLDGRPDVAIIDLGSPGLDGFRLARELGADAQTAGIPLILVGAERPEEQALEALQVGADDLFAEPFDEDELMARLRALLRISTMLTELHRRLELAQGFGVEALEGLDLAAGEEPCEILLAGPATGEEALIHEVLEGRCAVAHRSDLLAAGELLGERPFDACVLLAPDQAERDAGLDFCARVRNDSRLFNLPVVLSAPAAAFAERAQPYRSGATRLLDHPLAPWELRFALLSLVRRQRRRWKIRQAMEQTKQAATCDPLTGSYSLEFLHRHLENLVETARTWEKHLTLVAFSIPDVPGVYDLFGDEAGDHLMKQIAHWIAGLVRVEDLVARYSRHDFLVALPDTPVAEAGIVMHRVAGIISHTDFAVWEVYQPVAVAVEIGIAGLEPGDSADTLIARAHENLE